MAIDTSKLESLYTDLIHDRFDENTIEREEATIILANYLAALTAENGLAGDTIQSWTMAGKTFTKRDMSSLRSSADYRAALDNMLGRSQQGAFLSMGGVYTS